MGFYKYMRQNWNSKEIQKERAFKWRREPVIQRIDRPTRLDRARALGYKAKQGYILARIKIGKGSSKREAPAGGRKPTHAGLTKHTPKMNLRHIAEMRVARKFPNLEVLNSYYCLEDGRSIWHEVILVDPQHPCIKSDKKINWICAQRRRIFRGLSSAAKRSRIK